MLKVSLLLLFLLSNIGFAEDNVEEAPPLTHDPVHFGFLDQQCIIEEASIACLSPADKINESCTKRGSEYISNFDRAWMRFPVEDCYPDIHPQYGQMVVCTFSLDFVLNELCGDKRETEKPQNPLEKKELKTKSIPLKVEGGFSI